MEQTTKQVTRCALYVRVSTQNQMGGDYNSLETQRERLQAYVHSQEDWEVHQVYEEGGFSGAGLNRPALQAMLTDIARGEIDCVLAYKIDRLTRNQRDFYWLIDCFEQYKVSFISVTQHFDTSNAMGRLLRNILLDFAQFEREMTSERTRDKMEQRAQKGYWNGGNPPFGYRSQDRKLVFHPEEAEIVRLIFKIFISSGSLAKVRQELKARGLKTRKGKEWSKTSIDNVIRNPVYIGKLRYRGQTYPGQHEPILEEGLFLRSQAMHKTEVHVSTRIKRPFLLRGLLRCEDCGSMMTPHYTKKKTKDGHRLYFYYRCSKTMHYDKSVCKVRRVGAEEVENLVVEDIGKLISDSNLLISSIEQLNHGHDQQLEPLRGEEKQLQSRSRELEKEANNYVSALGKGTLSIERLENALKVVEDEKQIVGSRLREIQEQLEEIEFKQFDHQLIRENLTKFQNTLSTLTEDEKAECLQLILKDVVLSKKTIQLNIYDLPEFNYESSKKRQDWLPR